MWPRVWCRRSSSGPAALRRSISQALARVAPGRRPVLPGRRRARLVCGAVVVGGAILVRHAILVGGGRCLLAVGLLAKRMGTAPKGWKARAGVFADATPRSVADIDGPDSLARVCEFKKAMKAARRDKQGRPQG